MHRKAPRLAAVVAALALLAGACGNGDSAAPPASPPATATPAAPDSTPAATPTPTSAAEPPATATPAAPDPTPAAINLLDRAAVEQAAAEWMEQTGVPALVVSFVQGDDEPESFAFGVTDLATGRPTEDSDYFRIGSITKTVTTAVVMQLVEEGLVDLDATVSSYLGSWAAGYEYEDDVTVRQLLNHTNGFFEYATDSQFYSDVAGRLADPIEPEEILAYAANVGPKAALGTEYSYNTTGFLAAGLIIEAVTGNTAEAEIRSRIFEPLGLEDIYLPLSELPPGPLVNGYLRGTTALLIGILVGADEEDWREVNGVRYLDILTVPQELVRSAGWTGGSLEAQIDDVARLYRGLFTGGLLSPASITEMTTPSVNPGYALGVDISPIAGMDARHHGGGVPGFRSMAAYFPGLDVSIAVSSNQLPSEPDIGQLMQQLAMIAAATWQPAT